jgi:hypothetical protein
MLVALCVAGLSLGLAACGGTSTPKPIKGATTSGHRAQLYSILQSDGMVYTSPTTLVAAAHNLGAQVIRFNLDWANVAPDRDSRTQPKFNATNPGAYPTSGWGSVDLLDRLTAENGVKLFLTLTSPAPLWATGASAPRANGCSLCAHWEPSASDYEAWVKAVGRRYDGKYTPKGDTSPLPRISFWSIWNEPNYGQDLAPQSTGTKIIVDRGAPLYRKLVDAGWAGLTATGHTPDTDTILIGETAPRGILIPGNGGMTTPLQFARDLYCVDGNYQPLTGSVATTEGCPADGSKTSFAAENPGLFKASGWSDHPYADGNAPDVKAGAASVTANYADFSRLDNLASTLDQAAAAWGTDAKLPIFNTEYGNFTKPPSVSPEAVSLSTAAKYLNWTEYLSWKDPRIGSYDQYLLQDPDPKDSQFFSGIETSAGVAKPILYDAYRLPLFLPQTSADSGAGLTVWGCARPVLTSATPVDRVAIQFAAHGSHFRTLEHADLHVAKDGCYFETQVKFPASGNVRLAYGDGASAIFSRTQAITLG